MNPCRDGVGTYIEGDNKYIIKKVLYDKAFVLTFYVPRKPYFASVDFSDFQYLSTLGGGKRISSFVGGSTPYAYKHKESIKVYDDNFGFWIC